MGSALLVFVLLLGVVSFEKSSSNIITINSIDCIQGKELCPNMTCAINVFRKRLQTINCGCVLSRPLYNITADLTLQRKNGKKYEVLVKTRENLCKVVRKTTRSQAMARIFESVSLYMNSFKCPFQGNVSVTNLPVTLDYVPGFVPKSNYQVLAEMSDGGKPVISVELHFSIGNEYGGR